MRVLLVVRNRFRLSNNFVISAILIGGFSIRLIGINIGLPDSPDPREVLIAQDVLNLIHFTAPPQIYNWPGTAWFYVIAAAGKLLSFVGLYLTEVHIILLARCVNTLLSTATLWFTYRIGVHCYSKRIGQIAAGLLTVAMLHATNESRFALVDIPATFCVTLFLWFVTRARSSAVPLTFQTAIWLGVMGGIGFAVKFPTVFVGISLLAFIRSEGFYKKLGTIVGISALTFTFLCPYWVIDLVSPEWNLFFEDFWYEATHYHRGHFGLIAASESGLLHRFTYLWTLLKWGMGLPLALLVSLGVICALASLKRRGDGFPTLEVLLLAFIVPYLLFIGAHKVKFTRHLLILYPALAMLAAIALTRLPNYVMSLLQSVHITKGAPSRGIHIFREWFGIVLGGIVVLYSFVYTLSFASILLSPPTKIAASNWITAHIPQEESIVVAPDILFSWLLPELDFMVTDEKAKWVLILGPDYEVFRKYQELPQHYQAEDWYPLSEVEFEETLAFYKRVLGQGSLYALHETFKSTPKFFGIQISDKGAPFPMRALAHPELRIYRRSD